MKLYEITTEMQTALALLDATDGEVSPELFAYLDSLELQFAAKAEAVVKADRFHKIAAAARRQADGLKMYLKMQLEILRMQRCDAGLFDLRIQANSQPAVKCDVPIESLPEAYVVRREVISLDTAKVIEAAKAGAELPPGLRVERGTHLRVS